MTSTPRSTTLYRFFDANGDLLYVGITGRSVRRWVEHAASKDWWPLVASSTVAHFDYRIEALDAERRAIQDERPRFNIVHAGKRPQQAPTIVTQDGRNLEWSCDACGSPVSGAGVDRGWITVDVPRSDATAEWKTYHQRCDPDADTGYWIDVRRLATSDDLFRFSDHVAGKRWIDRTDWFGFVLAAHLASQRDRF